MAVLDLMLLVIFIVVLITAVTALWFVIDDAFLDGAIAGMIKRLFK